MARRVLGATLAAMGFVWPALAHHSFAAEFEADKTAELRGKIVQVYTQPLVRRRGSARDDDVDIGEQASCDPDSFYRDLLELGRLDEHLSGE